MASIIPPSPSEAEDLFRVGELYLFLSVVRRGTPEENLWAIFADRTERGLHFESSTSNFADFRRWHDLPSEYEYARPATRDELRDYTYGLAVFDMKQHHG